MMLLALLLQEAVPVRTAEVESTRVKQTTALVGTVRAWRRSVVASEVEGRVAELPAEEGRAVSAGAPLARLDSEILEIQVRGAESALAAAHARHEQSRARLERLSKLIEQNVVSDDEIQTERLREEELGHDAARAGEEVRRLKSTLEKKIIPAPFDGIVTAKRTELGQWVAAGGAVAELVDLSRVEVRVDLPERYVGGVVPGTGVDVRADAHAGRAFAGTVVAVVPVADDMARTFPLRIEVSNGDAALKDGMLCRVEVPLEAEREALLVPKDAIVPRGDASFVVLVVDGRASIVPVTVGRGYDANVEVSGPAVRAGAVVVTHGNERLRDGTPVKPE